MRKVLLSFILILAVSAPYLNAQSKSGKKVTNSERAKQTLDNIYTYYSEENTPLLHENYPFDVNYTAGYLAQADTGQQKHFAYLWPFSGTFSGVNALLRTTKDKQYLTLMEKRVLPALQLYYDDTRQPPCYQSYLGEAGHSDRFYDDNVWVAIDLVDLYMHTKEKKYLEKSKEIWTFILSGTDDKLGGGIYWCEQKKQSKNTCSNAPGSVLAFKLFEATRDSSYFQSGLSLYNWTKTNLQDPEDKLYFDNMGLNGHIGKAKFPYNSGQMLQAASLLYKLTGKKEYLMEAQQLAEACAKYFTSPVTGDNGKPLQLIKRGNVWFVAVMFRGFVELYHLDHNKKHITLFNENLEYAWNHNRDKQGLFSESWDGKNRKDVNWLLDQAAMVEMYGAIGSIIK